VRTTPTSVTDLLTKAAACWDRIGSHPLQAGEVLYWSPETGSLDTVPSQAALSLPVKAAGLLEPPARLISGLQQPFTGAVKSLLGG
jgi:hypothetical protein